MCFSEKVYDAVAKIPKGYVATYGQIAIMAGSATGARAVGNILHVNPYGSVLVPCHRVVNSRGELARRYAYGGISAQREHLKDEGVTFIDPNHVDLSKCGIIIESHPLKPFLPDNTKVLFLGSFPPPKARWSMDFFYPNYINDFWRIHGQVSFNDSKYFEVAGERRFDLEKIISYCETKGYALYDTASKVCRLKANASDDFLDILEPTDFTAIMGRIPDCRVIVTTGGKASKEFCSSIKAEHIPEIGCSVKVKINGRQIDWWRMPSSSRAYPMPLTKKINLYSNIIKL